MSESPPLARPWLHRAVHTTERRLPCLGGNVQRRQSFGEPIWQVAACAPSFQALVLEAAQYQAFETH